MNCTDDGCKITFCKTCIHYTQMIFGDKWLCSKTEEEKSPADGTDCDDWEGNDELRP